MKKVMYRETVIRAGKTIEVINTYPTQFGDNLARENRGGGKGTPEAVARYNRELAKRRLTRLINANFSPDDLWITFTYEKDKRPESKEAAKTLFNKFMRKLRALYRKNGSELKALKRTTHGERGALHHHLIINKGVPTRDISKLWHQVSGAGPKARAPYYVPLYPDGEYSGLASYLVDQLDIGTEEFAERKWTGTRNLTKPVTESVKDIFEIKWQEPPQAREGYYIDYFSIKAGTNEVTGRPYLFYRMIEIDDGFTCRDDNGKLLTGAEAATFFRKRNSKYIRDEWFTISDEGEVIFYDGG